MNKPSTCLFPIFAIPFVVACLGVSARAVAQDPNHFCYQCQEWEKNTDYYACVAVTTADSLGHKSCSLLGNANQCGVSTGPDHGPDCKVVPTVAGRVSLGVKSAPSQAVGGRELPRWVLQAVPAVDVPQELTRHRCTGAIIQRRYSSKRIAELRSGVRRVTI